MQDRGICVPASFKIASFTHFPTSLRPFCRKNMGVWDQSYLNSIVTSSMASLCDVGQVNELPEPWFLTCEKIIVLIICQTLIGRYE